MQEIAGWPEDTTVTTPTVRVLIDGFERDPLSWSVDHEFPAGLPNGAVGGTGITACTAELVFSPASGDSVASPWSASWPPRLGASVQIFAGYGQTQAQVFMGSVTEIAGGTESDLRISCTDAIKALHKRVFFPPMLATSPRLDQQISSSYIYPGLTPNYFLTRAAQVAGFHVMPAPVSGAFVYATLNGSAWHSRGTLIDSKRHTPSSESLWPRWLPSPWGMAPYDLQAVYRTALSGAEIFTSTLSLSVMVGQLRKSTATISMRFPDGSLLSLSINPVAQRASLSTSAGAAPSSLPIKVGDILICRLRVDGSFTLKSSSGASVSGQVPIPAGFVGEAPDTLTVICPEDSLQIGAVQAYFGADETPLAFTPTMVQTDTSTAGTLEGTPGIEQQALTLLQDISKAELAGLWIDSRGRLNFRSRLSMLAQEPVATKTALDDIYSYEWARPHDSVYSQVTVKGQKSIVQRAHRASITLWQGSGDSLGAGENHAQAVEPEAGEAWLGVAEALWNPAVAAQITTYPQVFNLGLFSWAFGTSGEAGAEKYASVESSLVRLGTQKWLLTMKATENLTLKTPAAPTNGAAVAPIWQGENLPLIRGKARMRLVDFEYTSATTGPATADEYIHEGSFWVNNDLTAQRIADGLAQVLTAHRVILQGVRIVPDSRLELGDVILLRDDVAYQRLVRFLISGVKYTGSAGSWEQQLTGQIISDSSLGMSYAEQAEALADTTYQQQETVWASQPVNTYSKMASKPGVKG